ncbi:MAG: endonuclease [Bacteroidales bacterium]|nr:endonuclease [Bacteroidales bacterium]
MKRLLTILLLMIPLASQSQEGFSTFSAAWWNVENLFDLRDDPQTNDDEFTPDGERHWTRRRLNAKLEGIYKTLVMMDLPDVVGLGEVENAYVLRELCQGTPLAQVPYRYVHYDSPDRRGIDVALIYRTDRFTVTASRTISVSDSAEGYYTRDILVVEGVTKDGDSVCVLVNHWPSKRGGEEADAQRLRIADTLRRQMVELHAKHPSAAIIAMGDMNSTADEEAIAKGMGFAGDSISPDGIRLLTLRLPRDMGSHKYQGQWRYIDQMFLLADEPWEVKKLKLLRFDHLLTDDGNRPGQRPKRTYQGPRYEGGLSDHLPLLLRLVRK